MKKAFFEPLNIIGIISLIFFFSVLLTWERGGNAGPIENSVNYVIVPLQKGLTYFGDMLQNKVDFVKNVKELEKINSKLQKRVDELTYENIVLEQSKEELNRLRELYELDQQYSDFEKTGARVIAKEPGNWFNEFTIDKGAEDGLEEGMVVLSGAGLCGRIIKVFNNSSVVLSVIDDRSRVSASVSRTSDTLIVKGDLTLYNKGYLEADYIDEGVNPVVGDKILTSELGQYYPSGILIGSVIQVDTKDDKTKKVYVKPYVNFKRLKEVLIITTPRSSYE